LSSVSWADAPAGFEINDKLVHFGIFAVFGITLAHAGRRTPGRLGHAALLAIGILYALSDEFHQSFVPGRTPSIGDLVADTVGLAVGYAGLLASTTWRGTRSVNGSTGHD
jgi:VanZ family protein